MLRVRRRRRGRLGSIAAAVCWTLLRSGQTDETENVTLTIRYKLLKIPIGDGVLFIIYLI